jgi:3-hydroxyacyl-[acyl-carrier protein] dehydratase/trans-2-decenoyl-[acyl-carrier protein] isomerase
MNYQEFQSRTAFSHEELVAVAYGSLIDDLPEDCDARLPAPPFLMVDRVLSFSSAGPHGSIAAEQDIRFDAWYFQCHMPGDPVQPGCLCVDAVWQLLGFYCIWRGALGSGRALGCGEVAFNGQVRPFNRLVRYEIDVKRRNHCHRRRPGFCGRRSHCDHPGGARRRVQGHCLSRLSPALTQRRRRHNERIGRWKIT